MSSSDADLRMDCLRQAFLLHPTQTLSGQYPNYEYRPVGVVPQPSRPAETKHPPRLEDVLASAEKLFAYVKGRKPVHKR